MRKHPATYTDSLLPYMAEAVKDCEIILDPLAGSGKVALIKEYGYTGIVVCNDLEREWVDAQYNVDEWHFGDAANMLWSPDNRFDAIVVSPVYGNRMSDHYNVQDNSKRRTYQVFLGRDLNEENAGRMQWGKKYRDKHVQIWKECKRVLGPDGIFVLNISDHVRNHKIVNVSAWHNKTITDLGFTLLSVQLVATPRFRYGENNQARVDYENIYVYRNNA